MGNLINTVDWLAMESLRTLVNKLQIASRFNTDENKNYDQKFPVGETIRIKLPQRWTVKDGIGYQPQPVARKFTTATMNRFKQIGFDWDSIESALKLERTKEEIFREYFKTSMEQMAQEIDSTAAQFLYQNTNHITGILGQNPTSLDPFQAARQKLVENAGMTGEIVYCIAPAVNRSLATGLASYLNPSDQISKLFKDGYLGHGAGGPWYESMSLYSHTAGTWAGAVTVNGANQSGSSMSVTDTSGDTFNVGDVFTIAGVYEVNPMTRRTTGSLKQFTISQALTAGGTDTIVFQPALIGPDSPGNPDQYQNVDSLPASGAALTLFPGTPSPNGKSGTQNFCFTRDAAAIVAVELEMPKAVEFSSQKRDPETGIAVRITRTWDAISSRVINRVDVLYGFGLLYPDNCSVRIASA